SLSSAVESSLHNDIQALLREMNSETNSCLCSAGLLRWTLEKKVETNPSCSIPLIQALVRELEEKLNRANKVCFRGPHGGEIFPGSGSSRGAECKARCRWFCSLHEQTTAHAERHPRCL
uniref:Uncharacterized protein n=1 Tax=Monopterus albus TaxID=43700 RepID=A0A3Q3IMA7_MONAL